MVVDFDADEFHMVQASQVEVEMSSTRLQLVVPGVYDLRIVGTKDELTTLLTTIATEADDHGIYI